MGAAKRDVLAFDRPRGFSGEETIALSPSAPYCCGCRRSGEPGQIGRKARKTGRSAHPRQPTPLICGAKSITSDTGSLSKVIYREDRRPG